MAASEVPGSEVWAVEKSATTAEWTRRNFDETAKRYPAIAGNYHLDIADATQMPTLSQLDGTIDIVLTNPPYVPLAAFARTCGFVDVTVHNDYTGRPRYLTAEKQPAQ